MSFAVAYAGPTFEPGERVHFSWMTGRGVRGDPMVDHRVDGVVAFAWVSPLRMQKIRRHHPHEHMLRQRDMATMVAIDLDGGGRLVVDGRRVHHNKRKAQQVISFWSSPTPPQSA